LLNVYSSVLVHCLPVLSRRDARQTDLRIRHAGRAPKGSA
jgi:hypothetical protein